MQNYRDVPTVSYRAYLTGQIKIGRRTLLGVIVMTLINLTLLLTSGDNYMLFSASVPYYLTWFGWFMDGGIRGSYTFTGLMIGAVILAIYFLLWILSRKNAVWLTWAAVLFGIDLAALIAISFLFFENPLNNLVDVLIHIVVIGQIIKGAKAGKELPTAPPEITFIEITDDDLHTDSHI